MFKLIGVVACVAVLGAGVGVAASAPGATAGAIVYHARLKGPNNEIFVVNPKTGVAMRVTRIARATRTPPGRRTGRGSRSRATATRATGATRTCTSCAPTVTGVQPLTFSRAFDGDPAWSGPIGSRSRATGPGTWTSGRSTPTAAGSDG